MKISTDTKPSAAGSCRRGGATERASVRIWPNAGLSIVRDDDMEGKKTYPKSKTYLLNILYDIIELQNGELILCDTVQGKLLYQLTMYGYIWQLLYNITEIKTDKCEVAISVTGERQNKAKEIRREFALLDMMLEGGADVKIV